MHAFFSLGIRRGIELEAPFLCGGDPLQEVVPSGLVEALLQDLDALFDVAQLLAVALDLVLDVGQLARGVHLQLFQHALLALPQVAVEALEGVADGSAQALGRGLPRRGETIKKAPHSQPRHKKPLTKSFVLP